MRRVRVALPPESEALKLTVRAVDDRGVRAQVTTDHVGDLGREDEG